MFDVGRVYQAGESRTARRWFTNPIRRFFWWAARPYFVHIVLNAGELSASLSAIDARLTVLEREQRRKSTVLRTDQTAIAHRLLGLEAAREKEKSQLAAQLVMAERSEQAIAEISSRVDDLVTVRSEIHVLRARIESIGDSQKQLVASELQRQGSGTQEADQLTSYSQSGEDRICAYILRSIGVPWSAVRYVDVGAALPDGDNNTYFFYRQGASGLLVEADPKYGPLYSKIRPRDAVELVAVVPSGFGAETATLLRPTDAGWTTIDREHLQMAYRRGKAETGHSEIPVPARSLPSILDEHFSGEPIHVLSIDVEGLDGALLADLELRRHRPMIIVVENVFQEDRNEFHPVASGLLSEAGYRLYASTHLNSIFIDGELMDRLNF